MIVSSRVDVELLAKVSEFIERSMERRVISKSAIINHALEMLVTILEQQDVYLQEFTVPEAIEYFDSIGLPCHDTLSANEQRVFSETRDEELPSLKAVREMAKLVLAEQQHGPRTSGNPSPDSHCVPSPQRGKGLAHS
jgi:hypothetical protein